MNIPEPIWIYRITHIDNLFFILKNGIHTKESPHFDPNYVSIGDSSLISYRKNLCACDPPGGKLSEYIPFYLGPRSPMLYQIATGYEDIKKIPVDCIEYIGVFNNAAHEKVLDLLAKTEINIKIRLSPQRLYYDNL